MESEITLKEEKFLAGLKQKNLDMHALRSSLNGEKINISMWTVEWGYETIFSCCTGAKAGVAILFNNNYNFKQLESFSRKSDNL